MADDIKSIYKVDFENHKVIDYYLLEKVEYGELIKGYSYNKKGAREKLMDMAQAENRLPSDAIHAGLVRYLYSTSAITNSVEALRLVAKEIANSSRENMMAVLMDEEGFPIALSIVGMGAEDQMTMDFNETLKAALLCDAKKIIIIHNHSCIDEYSIKQFAPSTPDYTGFHNMANKFSVFGIEVLDSVIVSERFTTDRTTRRCAMYSIKEKKMIIFNEKCEVNTYQDLERKTVTNHTRDFDENGLRVKNKQLILSPEGLDYSDDEEEKEM